MTASSYGRNLNFIRIGRKTRSDQTWFKTQVENIMHCTMEIKQNKNGWSDRIILLLLIELTVELGGAYRTRINMTIVNADEKFSRSFACKNHCRQIFITTIHHDADNHAISYKFSTAAGRWSLAFCGWRWAEKTRSHGRFSSSLIYCVCVRVLVHIHIHPRALP